MRSARGGSRERGDSEHDTANAVTSRRGIKRFVAGVLMSDPGDVSRAAFTGTPTARIVAPRFPYSGNLNGGLQLVTGVHRVKRALRDNPHS